MMRRVVRATALCALVALFVVAGTAQADALPASPCAAAGIVAIVQPGATAPVTVGPAVSAADTQGDELPTFQDAQYGVDLTGPAAGAAGCVASGPGGTHVEAGAWSVLSGAVAGRSLRADLVPPTVDDSGWHLRASVTGLEVDGTPVDAIAGATVAVGNWAKLTIGAQRDLPALRPLRYWAAALELQIMQPHMGLPAGTVVLIGYAGANRAPSPQTKSAPPPTTTTTTTPSPPPVTTTAPAKTPPRPAKHKAPKHRHHAEPKRHPRPKKHAKPKHAKPKKGQPLTSTPPLGGAGYVFPLANAASWGDSYGANRSDVPGGWHHGDDLFAPLGTPVVAVADGTVFAVGWNHVGGWRFWLVDRRGNDFYYAHLSGYTSLAQNDREVKQGDVLGFVGNTGDAVTTPPHLHFEVHPSPLLYLGYDGAVDPTSYLRAWPLVGHVKALPPVELPGVAPTGFGSVTDFRRLLTVRPLKTTPKPAAKPAAHSAPLAPPPAAHRVAARASKPGGAGSPLPIVFGILLAAAALAAIAHSARDGRNT